MIRLVFDSYDKTIDFIRNNKVGFSHLLFQSFKENGFNTLENLLEIYVSDTSEIIPIKTNRVSVSQFLDNLNRIFLEVEEYETCAEIKKIKDGMDIITQNATI